MFFEFVCPTPSKSKPLKKIYLLECNDKDGGKWFEDT